MKREKMGIICPGEIQAAAVNKQNRARRLGRFPPPKVRSSDAQRKLGFSQRRRGAFGRMHRTTNEEHVVVRIQQFGAKV